MQTIKISVIICTYNPNPRIFEHVLEALKKQTLAYHFWELIIVDNSSKPPVAEVANWRWHPAAKLVTESRAGLAFARMAGFEACKKGTLIVFIDDDNVAAPDYLAGALSLIEAFPQVGCFGGRSIPQFEESPPVWFDRTGINLGCQDFGSEPYISAYAETDFALTCYPEKAPIGTGMVITYSAFAEYYNTLTAHKLQLGRSGKSLGSGEDNDIVMTIIKSGYEIAYFPALLITHRIPPHRLTISYLKKMAFESNVSWMRVLTLQGANPHRQIASWTFIPRAVRAWLRLGAWKNPANYIHWRGACGVFKGLINEK